MRSAATALTLLLAAALAAGCTSEAEPPAETDDAPFGGDPDFEAPTADLMAVAADQDAGELCDALEAAFEAHDLNAHPESVGRDTCGFEIYDFLESDQLSSEELYGSGIGAALPIVVHAWSDDSGGHLRYFDPADMFAAVTAAEQDELGRSLSAELAAAVTEAAGAAPEPVATADLTYTEIDSDLLAEDLISALEQAGDGNPLTLSGSASYGSAESGPNGGSVVFTLEGEDREAYPKHLYDVSPAIGAADRVTLHVRTEASGNGVISYFDPMPMFSAIDPAFTDAGTEMSTLLSEAAWDAALQA